MLIRQTLSYLPAQLLGPLVQFAAAILLTHYLQAADYGLTMLVFASQELAYALGLSWWSAYYLRYAGSFTGPEKVRLEATDRAVVLIGAVVQAAAIVAVILFTDPAAAPIFVAGAAAFVVSRGHLAYLAERARREENILGYSLIQIAAPAGGLALALALLSVGAATPADVLFAYAGMQTTVAILVVRRLRLTTGPARFDRSILTPAIGFGLPFVVSGVFGWLAGNGIRFVVEIGAGVAALGLLSVGWGLAGRLASMAAMLVTAAAYPLAVKAMNAGDPDLALRQLSLNSALLLAALAPATLGAIVIADPMITLLVSADYRAVTAAILPAALIGAAIRNLRIHGWDQLYLLAGAPGPMVVLEGIEALLTVVSAAAGLAVGGLEGAVIGTTLAAVAIAAGDLFYLTRRFGLRAPFGLYARILAAALAMFAALSGAASAGWTIAPDALSLALAILAGGLAYALALAVAFPRQLKAAIARFAARRGLEEIA